jgi:hypothetical protein
MKKLMSSSMFGLVPIPLADTISSHDEVRPSPEIDDITRPMEGELARIREELEARGAESTKHAHWCSVLMRATWRRVYHTYAAGKSRRP